MLATITATETARHLLRAIDKHAMTFSQRAIAARAVLALQTVDQPAYRVSRALREETRKDLQAFLDAMARTGG